MIITIDIGNSNIKIGVFDKDILLNKWKIPTDVNETEDNYKKTFKNIINDFYIDGVVISSVVPNINEKILNSLTPITNNIIKLWDENTITNLRINKDLKRNLGQDIIVDLVAAKSMFNDNFIVIDMGTATTVNIVGNGNVFLGGVIIPGFNSMAKSLANCAQLPDLEIKEQEDICGETTSDAMNGGVFWGYIGMLEKVIFKLKEKFNIKDVKICLTGSLANIISNKFSFDLIEKNLTLKGLNEIYKINSKNNK